MVKNAYAELFNLHQDAAWELSLDDLIRFLPETMIRLVTSLGDGKLLPFGR